MRLLLVGLMLVVSSCGLFGPRVLCDESTLPEEMTCAEVVALARAELAHIRGITQLTAVRGLPCDADSLSCGPDVPAVVTVYADLEDGRRFAVPVAFDGGIGDGLLRAGPLQAMEGAP